MTQRQRKLRRLIFLNITLLIASLFWYANDDTSLQLAVAKNGRSFYPQTVPAVAVDAAWVQRLALAQLDLSPRQLLFVDANPLTAAEARPWAAAGCRAGSCAHAVFYDQAAGGTLQAVVNLETAELVASWQNPLARPAGSAAMGAAAVAIAAADPEVSALLGDVRGVEQVMVPMSGWLSDGACREDWCVDLTFHDPAGSGRVVHVFVDMVASAVDRIFYTRGRAEQPRAAVPAMQRFAFTDDCFDGYGWSVCWEMTAHDGMLFRDATFGGSPVFATIKIPQVEAWYPSWPGGYRDEIGFNASVPPFGNTQVTEFDDGFEVRQLFTEFTHWPNCICCYRYEEVIRFYADGAFEPRFLSHGPGCDDLSVYRPFWRIDLDLAGPDNDRVMLWQNEGWQLAETEFELFPLVDDVAPDGTRLGVADGERLMTWQMARTDPLGLDEARLFVLRANEGEGDGPLLPGPGDTFQPPRQWLDGESIVDTNLVFWFVPLLKTKKTAPEWCMPDPEPGINQCEAILRIAPAASLREPVVAELDLRATPTPVPSPTAVSTPAATPTPRPVQGDDVEDVILNAGCGSCHQIGALGEAHKVGPNLTNIAAVAGERVPGLSAEAYLRQSILEPNAFIAPECPNGDCLANVMPRDYSARLTAEQIDAIVQYLLTQVEPAPTPAPIGQAAQGAPKSAPAAKTVVSAAAADRLPGVAIQLLLVTLVLLLTLFRLAKE